MLLAELHRGSYMSTLVLLNLLNELKKRNKRAFYLFAMSFINSRIHEHEC